jgi:hypothetical protein
MHLSENLNDIERFFIKPENSYHSQLFNNVKLHERSLCDIVNGIGSIQK